LKTFFNRKKNIYILGFLCSRIATLDETDLSKDTEEHLVKTCKDVRILISLKINFFLFPKIALELDAEEFVTIVKLLSTLRSMQTLIARQELVNMIINQCHLEQGWNVRKIN
jgi:hypothetical protein